MHFQTRTMLRYVSDILPWRGCIWGYAIFKEILVGVKEDVNQDLKSVQNGNVTFGCWTVIFVHFPHSPNLSHALPTTLLYSSLLYFDWSTNPLLYQTLLFLEEHIKRKYEGNRDKGKYILLPIEMFKSACELSFVQKG